jgi:flagellar protein FlgJ
MQIIAITNLANVISFVNAFGALACEIQYRYELPATAILAQAALETGWGQSILYVTLPDGTEACSNNIFNIKAGTSWNGDRGFVAGAWEVRNGKNVREDSWFRVYKNHAAAFEGYAEYILARRMPDGITLRYDAAITHRHSAIKYIEAVQAAGYATDPEYSKKVISIMRSCFKLTNKVTYDPK